MRALLHRRGFVEGGSGALTLIQPYWSACAKAPLPGEVDKPPQERALALSCALICLQFFTMVTNPPAASSAHQCGFTSPVDWIQHLQATRLCPAVSIQPTGLRR